MMGEALTPDHVSGSGEEEDDDAQAIASPAKLIRLASMTRALLDEVRQSPLDDAGRHRLTNVHEQTLDQLRGVMSAELIAEFDQIFVPFPHEDAASESELRLAQAQLIGWLEGLFHGIQASLVSQQMAAQAQLAEMQRQVPPGASPPDDPTGMYL